MEIKEVKEALETLETSLNEKAEKANKEQADEIKALKAEIQEAKKNAEDLTEKALEDLQKQFDELAVEAKRLTSNTKPETKSFNDAFTEMIDENAETLSNLSATRTSRKGKVDETFELKVVGDMSFPNFGVGAYEAITTEIRPGLVTSPFSPLFLRNILPSASTTSAAIQYLRASSPTGEGAAAVWDETEVPLPDKPQVDYDFELVTEPVQWIAGYVRIHRSMLDDAAFLRTYIPNQLLFGDRGILVAENQLIYSTLAANSTAYDGTLTIPVERLYDAAYGQLRDGYFNATHILVNNRDYIALVALNKAAGSLEYDLPQGTIAIIGGQMTLGGIPVVAVPDVPSGEFLVIDNRQTQFVSRMSEEVRFFEQDRDNVIKNLVTIRAEERVAALVFNANAIISGTLEAGS